MIQKVTQIDVKETRRSCKLKGERENENGRGKMGRKKAVKRGKVGGAERRVGRNEMQVRDERE